MIAATLLALTWVGVDGEMPSLWDRLKLDASGRLRWESTFEQPKANPDDDDQRHRGRFRFRVGGSYSFEHDLTVHARASTASDDGLTGDSDANNPHWDFGDGSDGFSGSDIVLDRFWAQWKPCPDSELRAGKMPHAFATPPIFGEMVWDSDVQPAGFAAILACSNDGPKMDLRLVDYIAVESGNDDEPKMLGAQANLFTDLNDTLHLHGSTSYSRWSSLDNPGGAALAGSNQGNMVVAGDFVSDFALWDSFVALTCDKGPLGQTQGFVQYIDNLEESSQRGLVIGAGVGKNKDKGDLSLFGAWYDVDEDSIFSPVAQDDTPIAGSGVGSGMGGIIAGGEYSIAKDLTVRLWTLTSDADGAENNPFRIRLDLNFVVK